MYGYRLVRVNISSWGTDMSVDMVVASSKNDGSSYTIAVSAIWYHAIGNH